MSDDLARHMGAVARRLLGEPNKALSTRAELRWGRHGSLSADIGRGIWRDFETGESGGVLALIQRELGLAGREAIAWMQRELGAELEDAPRPAQAPSRPAPAAPDRDAIRKRELAQEVWRQTEPIADGLAVAYLVQRRGVPRWDADRLRWHPACPWKGGTAGCIVACVNDHVTACTTAIWRIRPVMEGPVERMGLGPVKGNAARLFWANGPELAIAEGVEDALAFHELTGLPTWAALSAGNMADLILPERFRRIVIVQDTDEPNRFGRRPGPDAAQALARRLKGEGRAVEILRPTSGKDANDALLAQRAGT